MVNAGNGSDSHPPQLLARWLVMVAIRQFWLEADDTVRTRFVAVLDEVELKMMMRSGRF